VPAPKTILRIKTESRSITLSKRIW